MPVGIRPTGRAKADRVTAAFAIGCYFSHGNRLISLDCFSATANGQGGPNAQRVPEACGSTVRYVRLAGHKTIAQL